LLTTTTTTTALKATSLRGQQQGAYTYTLSKAPRRTFLFSARSQAAELRIEHPDETARNTISLAERLKKVEAHIAAIKSSNKVESEETTLYALQELSNIAKRAIAIRGGAAQNAKLNLRQSSASAILSLGKEEPAAPQTTQKNQNSGDKPMPARNQDDDLPSPSFLSRLAEDLLRDDKVFVSAAILKAYVSLQKLLARPRTIPEALYLYANKPIPTLDSSPPTFKTVSPKSYKSAIPDDIAAIALDAAIDAKDMPLAMTIIDLTYTAPAYKRRKWMFKFGPPFSLVAISPYILYLISTEAALYSGYYHQATFQWLTFACLCVYTYGTGAIGWTALTTWSKHHERVVWRPGISLLDRWMREDERAALDKIAVAWGFKDPEKRGDESGEDWQALRTICFMRQMWLDKPDLMPGMNPPTTDEM
jgi:hypothetical protein